MASTPTLEDPLGGLSPGSEQRPRRPQRLSPAEAVRRHPLLFAGPVALLLVLAAVVGLTRDPVYTASSRLGIVRVDVTAPGALTGFALAGQALAETYSQAIKAQDVIESTARKSGRDTEYVATHVSATPVPQTPVFRVQAWANGDGAAKKLANAASTALLEFIELLNRGGPQAERLFQRFQAAAREEAEALLVRDDRDRQYDDDPTDAHAVSLTAARAKYESAQLQTQALGDAYAASQRGAGIELARRHTVDGRERHQRSARQAADVPHPRPHRRRGHRARSRGAAYERRDAASVLTRRRRPAGASPAPQAGRST